MSTKEFINEKGLVAPFGENSVLFTAEYVILSLKEGKDPELLRSMMVSAIESYRKEDGHLEFDEKEGFSHDNRTAVVCISKILGMNYHTEEKFKHWKQYMHPRDIVFYNYLKGGWRKLLATFFMWMPILDMIFTCASTYKVRNGKRIVKTDGKLLAWVRLHTVEMKLVSKICTYLLSKNMFFKTWKNVFNIYFTDFAHPINHFHYKNYEITKITKNSR